MRRFQFILAALGRGVTPEQWDKLEREMNGTYAKLSNADPGVYIVPIEPIVFNDRRYDLERAILVRPDSTGRMVITEEAAGNGDTVSPLASRESERDNSRANVTSSTETDKQGPKCPECNTEGIEHIVSRTNVAASGEGDSWFDVAYCDACGHVYGVFAKQ